MLLFPLGFGDLGFLMVLSGSSSNSYVLNMDVQIVEIELDPQTGRNPFG